MKRQNTDQAHNRGDDQNDESSQTLPLKTQYSYAGYSYSGGEWRKLQVTPVTNWMTPKLQSVVSLVAAHLGTNGASTGPVLSALKNTQVVVAPADNQESRQDCGRCLPPGLSTFVLCSGIDLEASLAIGSICCCRNVEVLTLGPVHYRIRASRRHAVLPFQAKALAIRR